MKKRAQSFSPYADRIGYRLHKNCCKVIYATLIILILIVLRVSTGMIPSSIKHGTLKPVKTERFIQSLPGLTRIRGGKVFKVPATWNRYQTPWFCPPVNHLKDPKQTNHRYLYSPTRLMTSDGIGHSMGVVNYEYNLALRLNLTYTHRVGFYSSLSVRDRYAVEDFFGWGYEEVQRKELQEQGCEPRNKTWPGEDNLYKCHFCGKPLRDGKMNIKQVVALPSAFGGSSCTSASCRDTQHSFFRKHHHSHTIFQINGYACKPPVTDSNMLETKNMFYHKYWNRHGKLLWANPTISSKNERKIRFDPGYINVAMHVRRGDFLEPETRKKRRITKDTVFAKVLTNVLSVVYHRDDPFSDMPTALHIYSEGKLLRKKVYSIHDVGVQDKAYYDSNGIKRDETWWKELLIKSFKTREDKTLRDIGTRMKIYLHVSENTIDSLHEMISADIFIGSASGLSANLVWSISRGVILIPHQGSIDNERGKKGEICCSVPFENNDGNFPLDLFETYWRAYVAANGDSAAGSRLFAQRKSTLHTE